MHQNKTVVLKDGRQLELTLLVYPIESHERMRLIEFLQQEWERSDVDWLQSMRGAYSETLQTQVVLGLVGGHLVGTASSAFPSERPEVGVIEDVMTCRDFRGLGIAAILTDHLVQIAWATGCRVVYLGNTPRRFSVYEKIGFERISGAIMRQPNPSQLDPERDFYVLGQKTTIRPTSWGDMPGVACLMAQPLEGLVVDFSRGLISSRYVPPVRCVSNFTVLWYGGQAEGKVVLTLAGDCTHRVLGFASMTPGPAPLRGHSAVIDAVTHDNYADALCSLLDKLVVTARQRKIKLLQAYVAMVDLHKEEHFRTAGFSTTAILPETIQLDGKMLDVRLMQRHLS